MLDPIESFDECIARYFTDHETGEVDYDFYGPDIHMVRLGYNTALAHMDLRDAHIARLRDCLARIVRDAERAKKSQWITRADAIEHIMRLARYAEDALAS